MTDIREWLGETDVDEIERVDARPSRRIADSLSFYIRAQSTGLGRYLLEQLVFALCSWIPGLPGVAVRGVAYRLLMRCRGWAAIESGVRICQPRNVTLHNGVYLDQGAYLHACPRGIEIGENTYVMHHAELHVYNFRGIEYSGIRVGHNCIIGEFSVVRGQGGVVIGDNVIVAPRVQILAVDHIFDDPTRPILEQGLQTLGIVVEDNAWIGAGAIILDGVRVGKGAVVGAGAVVTHDVPAHAVVAGVPARILRRIRRPRRTAVRERQVEREVIAR